jgi:hypothetical protein
MEFGTTTFSFTFLPPLEKNYVCHAGATRKHFFFEKKKQKTFARLDRGHAIYWG